jgi:aryl-alcohol dehydrogenase-like predicted oxidoreductase
MDRVKSLQDEGIIRHAGLSNVSVEDIEAASEVFKVATVQNRYNLVDCGREDVLPLVPACCRQPRQVGRRSEPDCPRLGSQAQPDYASHS